MRPTLRGVGTALVAAATFVMAWQFGTVELNVVAAAAVVALAVGAAQAWRIGGASVERSQPAAGFPGEARTITLEVGGKGLGQVHDHVGSGMRAAGNETAVALPTTVRYGLRLDDRGEHALGPISVTVTDVFGLFRTSFVGPKETPVIVYPELVDLSGHRELAAVVEGAAPEDRQEFDRLREYTPSDALRDVHWKSSAKRQDDLVVKELGADTREGSVTVAAGGDPALADDVASVAATLVTMAMDAGRPVALSLPEETVRAGHGAGHRDDLLTLLARTDAGDLSEQARRTADVVVEGRGDGVHVTIRDRDVTVTVGNEPAAADGGREVER
jgi:uncharacterized protein (DUF58 family)